MWSVSPDPEGVQFVWEVKGDRPAGEQHERERCFGGVKAVGPAGEQADLVVSASVRPLVDLTRNTIRLPGATATFNKHAQPIPSKPAHSTSASTRTWTRSH